MRDFVIDTNVLMSILIAAKQAIDQFWSSIILSYLTLH